MKNVIIALLIASTAFLTVLSYERNREFLYCWQLSQPGVNAVVVTNGFMDYLADALEDLLQ